MAEVKRLLDATRSLKHQAALSVAYGAGLRVAEVSALKVSDIDSKRMLLRIERGKGGRYRNAMLPEGLLLLLRDWWRAGRQQGVLLPEGWLFPGQSASAPISTRQLYRVVVEAADAAAERGIQPICEVLGTVYANSAFHGSRLDVSHIGGVMETLVSQVEQRGIDRHEIADKMVFISHETYTPARGGSAAAEINALRGAFGADAGKIVIANTKGFTGHAMGAGIEDVVAIKALETGIVPPVPNYKEPDPDLGVLNLSTGGQYPIQYALRLAAGFGSQVAMTLTRWTPMPDGRRRAPNELGYAYRIIDQAAWQRWLDSLSGHTGSTLEVDHRRLRIVDLGAPKTPVESRVRLAIPYAGRMGSPVAGGAARAAASVAAAPAPVASPAPAPAAYAAPGGRGLTGRA